MNYASARGFSKGWLHDPRAARDCGLPGEERVPPQTDVGGANSPPRTRRWIEECAEVSKSPPSNDPAEPPAGASGSDAEERDYMAADWAARLAEKDAVIAALTEQLELAAEQLDRLQRSGAARRKNGLLPPELAEDHKQLIGEMQRVVQQWEDLQAGLALGRIEVQLGELRDLVASRLASPAVLPPQFPAVVEPCFAPTGNSGAAPPPPEPPVAVAKPPGETSEWDRIKSQLLDTSEVPQAPPPVFDEPLPPPPPEVNCSSATNEELAAAIHARDEFIAYLLRRLRAAEAGAIPADWSCLAPHDPEGVQRLQQLAAQLDEKLRLSEVEFSLERARLAREHARLQLKQELLEKQLKRLGIKSADEFEEAAASPATLQDRRWVRFLGINRSS